MSKHRSDLTKGSVLPSTWVNALMEYVSTMAGNFALEQATSTTVRVVATSDNGQVGVGINGRWRYNTATVTATHPGGASGTYDVYVTASDNDYSAPDPTDNTNYAFGLAIFASGNTPATALYRKVGTVDWDGTQITAVRSTAGPSSIHASQHAVGAADPLWKYPTAGSALQVRDVGASGQVRAGRVLTAADFTQMGLGTPVAIYNLSNVNDATGQGSPARTLTNKGSVTFGAGITGAASEAAVFGATATQALYIGTGGTVTDESPFRIATGSWGCWTRSSRSDLAQTLLGKWTGLSANRCFRLDITGGGVYGGNPIAYISYDGTNNVSVQGQTYIADNAWHFVVATYDGTQFTIYVDGRRDNTVVWGDTIFAGSAPFNIGGYQADGSNNAVNPHYGQVDEAFVTADVLSAEQVRMLYATRLAHGATFTPNRAEVRVHRRRKGSALASGDFPTAPLRLYNFTAVLTSAGSQTGGANDLTATGAPVGVAGADGLAGGAYNFDGSTQYMRATDTGLPSGTSARSLGAWVRATNNLFDGLPILKYGTSPGNMVELWMGRTGGAGIGGYAQFWDGVDDASGAFLADGAWHFVVATVEAAPSDGLKRKLYVDGWQSGGMTTMASTTLAGANALIVGGGDGTTTPTTYWNGDIDAVFICNYALTPDQIKALYAKGSQDLGVSPANPGQFIERIDATNVYAIFDELPSQHQVDVMVGL